MRHSFWIGVLCGMAFPEGGCVVPECAQPAYHLAECRVVAEHEVARRVLTDGVELRFQDPRTEDTEGWSALGTIRTLDGGELEARPSTLGEVRLTAHLSGRPRHLDLTVDNVHPLVEPLTGEVGRDGLRRFLELDLTEPVTTIEGRFPEDLCDRPYRLVAFGDIQQNPQHFQRILDRLQVEADDAAAAGEPLLGLVLLGDLAEDGTVEELELIAQMLSDAAVPTAAIPGNHDIYASADALFNRRFGAGNMAFEVCDTHVLGLDTGNGSIAASVRGQLPELLESDAPFRIAATHHPVYTGRLSSGWTAEDQAQHLLAELARHDTDLMLSGHAHRRQRFDAPPVPQVIVGTGGAHQGAAVPDYGYLRMRFGKKLDSCFVPVRGPGPEIHLPKRRIEVCEDS